jgi:hypothetical protein
MLMMSLSIAATTSRAWLLAPCSSSALSDWASQVANEPVRKKTKPSVIATIATTDHRTELEVRRNLLSTAAVTEAKSGLKRPDRITRAQSKRDASAIKARLVVISAEAEFASCRSAKDSSHQPFA